MKYKLIFITFILIFLYSCKKNSDGLKLSCTIENKNYTLISTNSTVKDTIIIFDFMNKKWLNGKNYLNSLIYTGSLPKLKNVVIVQINTTDSTERLGQIDYKLSLGMRYKGFFPLIDTFNNNGRKIITKIDFENDYIFDEKGIKYNDTIITNLEYMEIYKGSFIFINIITTDPTSELSFIDKKNILNSITIE
ncbi:MAG: hypothetical protein H6Q25_118 [Bacteroidetes bacterium]|nr:hypothetical protein [Bacteroidota bacterium]